MTPQEPDDFTQVPFPRGMAAGESSSPDYEYSLEERICILDQAKLSCTWQQRLLLRLHYGISDLTLTQIAEYFQVSRSAVTQMHHLALLNLRRSLRRMGIRRSNQI